MPFALKTCGLFAARQATNFFLRCRCEVGNYAMKTFECRTCGRGFQTRSHMSFYFTSCNNFKLCSFCIFPGKGLWSASVRKILPFSTGRSSTSGTGSISKRHKTVALYISALAILVGGGSYAAVPLYRLYCQASGLGGTVKKQDVVEKIEAMERKEDRKLTIRFNADTSSTMQWSFKPQQSQIKLVPGETALAFYTAKNPTDKPITGVSTYNVIPFEAGQYFNKIQCFCFEEQRLNPHEEVDMPVFFYIDPEFTEDPAMYKVDTITLSYTFFEAREGLELPLPVH